MTLPKPAPIARVQAELGEGPVWDAVRQCLWFVDIKRHRLYRFDPTSRALQFFETPDQIGWALPAVDGTLIVGVRGGLFRFDPAAQQFSLIVAVEGDLPGNRLNDATTDATGAVWFGSMDDSETQASGHVYRYSSGCVTNSGLAPLCITNGPALSPDGATLYHTDTLGRRILASSIGDDHVPRGTRVFARIEDGAGYPDGPTVDSEGCVWTGLFGGWALRRYSPAGQLVATVPLPVANVTKMAFGGPDLKTAYVTTARKQLDATALASQPEAGNLFCFDVDVAGLPQTPAQALTSAASGL